MMGEFRLLAVNGPAEPSSRRPESGPPPRSPRPRVLEPDALQELLHHPPVELRVRPPARARRKPGRGRQHRDLGLGWSQVATGQETRPDRPWRAPVAGRAVVTWEGPDEPIMLTVYGPDGEVALTLAQELLTSGVAAIKADPEAPWAPE